VTTPAIEELLDFLEQRGLRAITFRDGDLVVRHFDEPCFATTYWWLRSTPASFVLTRGRFSERRAG